MKYFHCQDLRLLLKRYLDPMKDENFMSQSEVCNSLTPSVSYRIHHLMFLPLVNFHSLFSYLQVQALVATVHEILDFQVKFLKEIERPVESETGFEDFHAIEQFQVSAHILLNRKICVISDITCVQCGKLKNLTPYERKITDIILIVQQRVPAILQSYLPSLEFFSEEL